MAAPTVRAFGTPTNGTDAAPAFTVNAPAGVTAGDLLLTFAANDTTGTAWTVSPGNGWVKLSDEVQGATHRLAVYALIADGTDALSIAAANNQDYSVVMVAITVGTHDVTDVTTDIIIPAAATSASGNADPPASGTVTAGDWLAFAVCAVDMTATGDAISAAPTNYTAGAVLTKSASSTSSVGLGAGHRALTAATSEDPGTFTNTSRPWIAKTILIPPPGLAQDLTESPVDPVGVTDEATVSAGRAGDAVDTVGLTDVGVASNVELIRAEAVGITDSVTVEGGSGDNLTETPVDPVGIVDSAASVLDAARVQADPVGILDDVDVVLDQVIAGTADQVGITDTAAVVKSLEQSPVDPVGITDAATMASDRAASPTDPVGIVDNAALALDQVLDFVDPVGITDTSVVAAGRVVDVTDPVGVTDSVSAQLSGDDTESPVDPIGITDSVALTRDIVLEPVDSIGVTDSAALARDIVLEPVDAIGITDSIALARDIVLEIVDAIGITDSTVLAGAGTQTVTDNIGITDSITLAVNRLLEISDPVGITDSASPVIPSVGADICVSIGPPVFASHTAGAVAFILRSAEIAFLLRTAGGADMVDQDAGDPAFIPQAAGSPASLDRDAGTPTIRPRSATLAFMHGQVDNTLGCEE